MEKKKKLLFFSVINGGWWYSQSRVANSKLVFLSLKWSLKWSQYWYCILHQPWVILSPWWSLGSSFLNTIHQFPSPSSPSPHLSTPALPPLTLPASPPLPLPSPSTTFPPPLSLDLSPPTPPLKL